jgi:cyclophilin family peptidyl-prolyl cis-trans isomerase
VVPGHVIQTGAPRSERARGPGYTFPNEIHAELSHDHAGALNMANGGPHTNSSQWCITLGDRSYLDGDYTVFGEVVEGMDVVMRIVQGDVVDSVRIVRVGAAAEAFRPDTDSFRAQVEAAKTRIAADSVARRTAEAEWIAANVPGAGALTDSMQSITLEAGSAAAATGARAVRYTGTALRYMGHIIGHRGPPIVPVSFVSDAQGAPALGNEPHVFTFVPGQTEINPALDRAIAAMGAGERLRLVVPAALGYGRSGLYTAEQPGRPRLVISPNTLLVYEIVTQGSE